ncbi:MAG: glycosyltransferase N-terminal domain-containing protein [Paracoccaceae bacterium]|nr:glycosyltransferase N-terminal domain-containing protein [Paracoccaceae bacterium]
MADPSKAKAPGRMLRAYLAASPLLGLVAPWLLRRRLARGREDWLRWREKLGQAGAARQGGRLIWLHAVGIGEVMALRGLIAALTAQDAGLWFLVTSSARSSAQVFAGNLPARTVHQYLPLDAPAYLARFLDHWRPDLSVWAEQDIWPGAVVAADRRGIPLALINARMNRASYEKRLRIRSLYADLYARFALICAQDAGSARHLAALGARGVTVTGSLKAAAVPLAVDDTELARMRAELAGRRLWLAASTHAEDEAVALAAQAQLSAQDRRWLLILVPRVPGRASEILQAGMVARSQGARPVAATQVYLADTFGELGLWYRLAPAALIGGSFGAVQGHNPWEPAALGCAVLHGPNISNFSQDYNMLHLEDAARKVTGAQGLVQALQDPGLGDMAARASAVVARGQAALAPLAADLIRVMHG